MYEIEFTSRANREFKKLTPAVQERLEDAIDCLEDNPRQTGVKKLNRVLYRIRAGDWRIIFAILDKQQRVVIVKVARRSKDTYADLNKLF
ncbi:MAG: hypothetical protein A2Z28_01125 [Chloroflexi bacterium RBG_16_51_9]|nr:MAG: hypothetical protein A2Z28_01125 [Chloroflexi bacterium RBG_16_51_9]